MRKILFYSVICVVAILTNACSSAESSTERAAVLPAAPHAAATQSVTAKPATTQPVAAKPAEIKPRTWRDAANHKDIDWYKSDEAKRIAENVLLLQTDLGGWSKDQEYHLIMKVMTDEEKAKLLTEKGRKCSLDNGATHSQLLFLAKIYSVTGDERYKKAFLKGIDFLLTSQYPNGGWPQWYPMRSATSYSNHITFNDGAMIGAMRVLDEVAHDRAPYNNMADSALRVRCAEAVKKGVECILKCQIIVDGKKTGWCAQHDEVTFAPAKARSYELISISGAESTGNLDFLMAIENPSPEVIKAVEAAVLWFDKVKITGIREVEVPDANTRKGFNRVHVKDPSVPPIWARFYEIGIDKPMYVDRDGSVKNSIAEIESERRNGYRWTGQWPKNGLANYPAWSQKWTPGRNVLSEK